MKKANSSTPAKAAAARANGCKGRGPLTFKYTRWNALRHAGSAKTLSILEGDHLCEYPEFASLHADAVKSLGPGPLFVEDLIAVDKLIADAWRLRRSLRFELSETEKPDNGMLSPAMPNVLRYMNSANRQFDKSYARIKAIREQRRAAAAAQLAPARDLGGDEQAASEPPTAAAFSKAATVSAESLDTTPTTAHSGDAREAEEPRQSALPVPSASSEPSNGAGDTPDEALHSAAAADAAQPAQSPAAETPTTAVDEEEKGGSPGAG